jgi:hypothetical protein
LRDQKFNGFEAAEKLGFHAAASTFAELMRLSKDRNDDLGDFDRPLIAAASIAGKYPQFRPEFAELLRQRLAAEQPSTRGSPTLQAIWRADLRELTPELERLAAAALPPPNPNDVRPSAAHKARAIRTAWQETDALTKTKIDVVLTGYIGDANAIPEVIRQEFKALSEADKLSVRNFVTWMRSVDVGWSRHYLELTFIPHTPLPDIPFER